MRWSCFWKKYSSRTQSAENAAPNTPTAGYRDPITPEKPKRESKNAARSKTPFAVFFAFPA